MNIIIKMNFITIHLTINVAKVIRIWKTTKKNASKKLLAAEFDGFGQFLPFTFEGHLEGAT